jgi:hypothetical protein
MQAIRVETKIQKNGQLNLKNLPVQAGEEVEVIILVQPLKSPASDRYSLQGSVIEYIDPFEPVAEDDWDAIH